MKKSKQPPPPPDHLRIFFIECGDPIDAFESRSESAAVGGIAKLIGHSVLTFNAYSKRALQEVCAYLGSISDCEHDEHPKPMLCLHISCHGNPEGLWFGADLVKWKALLPAIKPVLAPEYGQERVLVISACHGSEHEIHKGIKDEMKKSSTLTPPQYIFSSPGKVHWDDAAVGWTLLYHLIPTVDLHNRDAVKEMLQSIYAVSKGMRIEYHRWDGNGYKHYANL